MIEVLSWFHESKNGDFSFETFDLKPNTFSGKLINLSFHGVITTMYIVLHSSLPAVNIFMS